MQGTAVVSFPEVLSTNYASALWLPEPKSLHSSFWKNESGEARVAEVYGSLFWNEARAPQEACPRNAVNRQLKRLADRGLDLKAGFELEFLLQKEASNEPVTNGPYYWYQKDMMAQLDLFSDFEQHIFANGVDVSSMHTEYSAGQYELPLEPAMGCKSADDVIKCKTALHDISRKYGSKPCFVTKANASGAASGLHFNFSIIDKKTGENIFVDDSADDRLSETAKHWIAGLLKHADALTALCCPTVNCYRRLHQPWGPHLKG